jgi:hypothetical protein
MPVCHDSKCNCNRADGVYKVKESAEHVRRERSRTLDRLSRVEGLTIEHRDHAVWLIMGGFTAPCIVGHGGIQIRTEFPDLRPAPLPQRPPLRVQFGVPGDIRKLDNDRLAKLIRQAHENYRPYRDAQAVKLYFERIIGRTAKIEGIVEGTAVVSARVRLTLDEAEEFARLCDQALRKDSTPR